MSMEIATPHGTYRFTKAPLAERYVLQQKKPGEEHFSPIYYRCNGSMVSAESETGAIDLLRKYCSGYH